MIVTRFAPSPTGALHAGHGLSALFAHDLARQAGGRFLLRIEDIDPVRCKSGFVADVIEDLRWLGLTWEEPVRQQSAHLADYAAALDRLKGEGLVYPCFCTRSEILAEAAASAGAPQGEDGPLYPRTCRHLSEDQRAALAATRPAVWRLDVQEAARRAGPMRWHDRALGWQTARPDRFGDVVLARKDVPTSYHLSVTVDDALQGVTLVTRGADLFAATDVHVLLQKLLDLPTPDYHHHPLVHDDQGRRLAKRAGSESLRDYRAQGGSVAELRARIEPWLRAHS